MHRNIKKVLCRFKKISNYLFKGMHILKGVVWEDGTFLFFNALCLIYISDLRNLL